MMIGDVASIAAAIGVLSALVGLRQVYRGRQRQFEMMYVKRYWSILDRLSLDAYDPCELGRWRRYLRGLAGATGV